MMVHLSGLHFDLCVSLLVSQIFEAVFVIVVIVVVGL